MKDTSKISNTEHEIRTAANACGVEPIAIRIAKHLTKSNDREVIYDWIRRWKGTAIKLTI